MRIFSSSLLKSVFYLLVQVKVVRDRMNEMIEVWKDIPECVNEISSPSLSKSSSSTGKNLKHCSLGTWKSCHFFFLPNFLVVYFQFN